LVRADADANAWVVPVTDVTVAGLGCAPGSSGAAREGLAVVSVGGAAAGGGGALRDLQRGLAAAAVDPCAGTDRDMLGVSGIVPDGVEAVFITAADGRPPGRMCAPTATPSCSRDRRGSSRATSCGDWARRIAARSAAVSRIRLGPGSVRACP
jgi:hypothetical protein